MAPVVSPRASASTANCNSRSPRWPLSVATACRNAPRSETFAHPASMATLMVIWTIAGVRIDDVLALWRFPAKWTSAALEKTRQTDRPLARWICQPGFVRRGAVPREVHVKPASPPLNATTGWCVSPSADRFTDLESPADDDHLVPHVV